MTEKQIENLARTIARALREAGLTSDACCCASSEPPRDTVKASTPAIVVCVCAGTSCGSPA